MSTKYPKPWYRPARGVWYVTIDGKQFNLGPVADPVSPEASRVDDLPELPSVPFKAAVDGAEGI